jgi:hypothetical protein
MNEPQPMLVYLLVVFLIAAGAAVILSARGIYEFQRRVEGRQLANMKSWNPFHKFSMSLRQQLSPEFLIFNIRACGAFMILFAIILLAIN